MSLHSKFLDYAKSLPLYILPHHLVSRQIYALTRVKSRFVPRAIRIFSNIFKVNLDEAANSQPESYATFNEFFTRSLKAGVRPIAEGENILACPVDGAVSQAAAIEAGHLIQAKGRTYSVLELLGGDAKRALQFHKGHFTTLYLSPRDYHRIHMPCEGTLTGMTYVPGRLFSVAPHTVRTVPNLFARNERVIAYYDTPYGPMALVLVGAINVAAIETTWAGLITPPNGKTIRHWQYAEGEHRFAKGQEMGRFNMGSTVVALFGFDMQWDSTIREAEPVRMGQPLAMVRSGQ